ncbi:hypothetical protein B0E46_08185 [Rhodanobacter sp. B04]|uniref:phytanoyl-CoA dioxygenase family protein n=1 Tax=Rhodanobacter sp. B04 TaxID=1945860 RepID=UPI00098509BF|nr:phytanoyl-CoA dioxygenase family protein [Rhodanobacter sp. B04]OOG63909.1 hypothetical protein B0E46_08185 [Rhodanobacter sp. B04]
MQLSQATFDRQGFAILPSVISEAECDRLVSAVEGADKAIAGSRRLLGVESLAHAAESIRSHPVISQFLAARSRAVQCTLFSKGLMTNWSVSPHQDLCIPVQQRVETPGWSGWSVKEGITFVQPPVHILEQLVAVRLQLDTHSSETGPLEVVPGTHLLGRLGNAEILEHASRGKYRCVVPRCGAVVMRPLIVHSSGKSVMDRRRRILHFLFGPPLPIGLGWAEMAWRSKLPDHPLHQQAAH